MTTDASIDPISNPTLFALLACDLAGFDLDRLSPKSESDLPDRDAVLEFSIRQGLSLSLAHESEGPQFVVTCTAVGSENFHQVEAIALRMSHHLHRSIRFSVDESNGSNLYLTHVLTATDLSLATLALAIRDAAELMQLVLTPNLIVNNTAEQAMSNDIPANHFVRG